MQYSSCSVASVFLNVTLIQLPLIGSPFVEGPSIVLLLPAMLEFEADKVKVFLETELIITD